MVGTSSGSGLSRPSSLCSRTAVPSSYRSEQPAILSIQAPPIHLALLEKLHQCTDHRNDKPCPSGGEPSKWMAFAIAAMLRFLTPYGEQPAAADGLWIGRMDPADPRAADPPAGGGREEYVPGLGFDLGPGMYEFQDGDGTLPGLLQPLGTAGETQRQPARSMRSCCRSLTARRRHYQRRRGGFRRRSPKQSCSRSSGDTQGWAPARSTGQLWFGWQAGWRRCCGVCCSLPVGLRAASRRWRPWRGWGPVN